MASKYNFSSLHPIVPTIAYNTFWKFAFERQKAFWTRIRRPNDVLTEDTIISKYKFTNMYRACDRVSQFLIRDVIYSDDFCLRDQFLRIMLFKLFNKIDTWKMLEAKFGEICESSFSIDHFNKYLSDEMNTGRVLYSNAYMMASGCKEFNVTRKHHAHLQLVAMMLKENLPEKIQDCVSMKEGYDLLLSYPMIGKFLAYQYITDINYSSIVDFSESEFTVPGPGARDGIRKCFSSLGGVSETELIKIVTDRQEQEFERLGLEFEGLGGRQLQYIDIQNIFCETDKYCRVAHPELSGISGRTKIKQLFRANKEHISFFFPPKWNIDTEKFYGRERLSSTGG